MKRILHKTWTVTKYFLAWGTHLFSYIVPRSKRVVVFSGLHRNSEREVFANNAKYQYLYMVEYAPSITSVWLGRDRGIAEVLQKHGLKSYYRFSLFGVYYALRAGITVVDAFLTKEQWQFIGTSKLVQLWHGKGFKRTGHDSPYSLQRYNKITSPQMLKTYDAIIAASPYIKKLMGSLFKAKEDTIHIAGLPRHDVLFHEVKHSEIDMIPELDEKVADLRKKGIKKVILYAPTFHPGKTDISPTDAADMDDMNTLAKKHNAYIFVQLHLKHVFNDQHDARKFSNIDFLEGGYDMYPTMHNFDALITDYSSIMIDFLLVDKPVILFAYDLEEYKKTMGVYEDFYKFAPLVKNYSEVRLELESIFNESFSHMKTQTKFKNLFFSYPDGDSARRIYERIISKL